MKKLQNKKLSMATQTFIAMLFGTVIGLVVGKPMSQFGFIGTIWLNCVKMAIAPMVFIVVVLSIASQKEMKSLGRVAGRIILYYIATTVMAAVIGIATTSVIKPGKLANLTGLELSLIHI